MKRILHLLLLPVLLASCGLLDESNYEVEEDSTSPTVIVAAPDNADDEETPLAAPTASESEGESPPVSGDTSLLRDFTLPVPLFAPDSAWNPEPAITTAVLLIKVLTLLKKLSFSPK